MAKPDETGHHRADLCARVGQEVRITAPVHVVPVAWAKRDGMGSVGPAVSYPEYSITVGHGRTALQVWP